MIRTTLLFFLLFSFIGPAAAEPAAATRGFLVFTANGVTNYVADGKGGLHAQANSSSGSIDEFLTANGRIYHLDMLLGKVSELDADLKPLREADIKSQTDVPYWLGTWEGGVLILNDNAVVYLDANLKEKARLPLDPRHYGTITPALNPLDFDTWEHRGYLLANSGELFVIPLQLPVPSKPLAPVLLNEEGIVTAGQWIDTTDKTLNLIGRAEREEQDDKLAAGEFRVVKEQAVYTYPLGDLAAAPVRTVVHEEREIHETRGLEPDEHEHPGMIIDRRPSYRSEGKDSGTYFSILSRTTPAYAEAFEEQDVQAMPQYQIVRLKSHGRYDTMKLSATGNGPQWFAGPTGRLYVESDMKEHELRLQPEPYDKLKALPELHEVYFSTLAY